MLNPDGRLWVDRLTEGLADTGERLSAADGERIVRLVAHHVGAEVHPASPRVSAELPDTGERFEGLDPARCRVAGVCHPQARGRRFSPSRLCRHRDHVGRAGGASSPRGWAAPQCSRRRRHLDRQDDPRECAPRRGGEDPRSRRADRGHARASVQGAEPRGAAHQGWRRLALRSRAFLAAASPRPHTGRRSARRRSTRSAESLGHRPSRRDRHHPCRLGARGVCGASSSSCRKRSSLSRAL